MAVPARGGARRAGPGEGSTWGWDVFVGCGMCFVGCAQESRAVPGSELMWGAHEGHWGTELEPPGMWHILPLEKRPELGTQECFGLHSRGWVGSTSPPQQGSLARLCSLKSLRVLGHPSLGWQGRRAGSCSPWGCSVPHSPVCPQGPGLDPTAGHWALLGVPGLCHSCAAGRAGCPPAPVLGTQLAQGSCPGCFHSLRVI